MNKHPSAGLGKRIGCFLISAVMLLGIAASCGTLNASAEEAAVTVDFDIMPQSSRDGTWGVSCRTESGALEIAYSAQYAEQRFDLPESIDAASVKKVTVNIASGDVGGFCIKLLNGTEQVGVAYGAASVDAAGVSFDGIGLMSLSETGGAYMLGGITFAVEEQNVKTTASALKDLYQDDFRMGVACEAISHWRNKLSEIGNPDKEALIAQEFNSITFGNELKPAYNMHYTSKEATETDLPFKKNPAAIEMLTWAKENGIPVRGHTLVWHSQCDDAVFCIGYKPQYLSNGKLDPKCMVDAQTMKLRLESYIYHVMEYMYANGFGDVIYAWDVVNEAIEPGANSNNMRNSYWYQIIGAEFLYDAFKYAREASEKYSAEYADLYGVDPSDPEALKSIQPKLFYNDYNEFQTNKRDAIIRAVAPIAADGYLDGIGMQGHLSDTSDIAAYITALKMYSDTVSEVQITELDVSQSTSGPNADYYQAVFYHDLFAALLQAKAEGANLTAVTIWGLTDDNSWKKETSPLIFNGDLTPKLAYTGIENAKTGAAMPEPEYVAPDLSDGIFTFNEKGVDAASLGFVRRGGGSVEIQHEVTHSGSGALLDSGRTESWHGASFDVSRFAGQTVHISAWVKSEARQVRLTADIDGKWPNVATATIKNGDWTEIKAVYTIPSDMAALSLYFETSDLSDIYIDDVAIKLVGMNEGFENAAHIAVPRGVGHMPVLSVTKAEKYNGKKSLQVSRQAQEATMQFDISKYVGKVIDVTAYVLTTDETIRMGVEGSGTAVEVPAGEKWTMVKGTFAVPATTSAQVFIETNGTADYYVDDISVRIGGISVNLPDDSAVFSPRWQGAGTLEIVDDNGIPAMKLSNQDQTYYGICFDVTAYLGMEVEMTFDVKTDDRTVKVTGDIDGVWPTFISAQTEPGAYKTVSGRFRLPNDLSSLRVYIETPGTADLYVTNFSISRAGF